MNKELDLLESKELRSELINRVEVLEKIKELILLPSTEFATVEQVAEYYEVDSELIGRNATNHEDELKTDGYRVFKRQEIINFLKGTSFQLENKVGKSIVTLESNQILEIPNRGLRLFSRRAILRIGMLLKDSKIAKEVRSYLLDVEEKINDEQREEFADELDEETRILINIIKAKDDTGKAIALNEYRQFKDGKIHKLEVENEVLVDGILKWDKRKAINRMVRLLSANKYGGSKFGFSQGWSLVSDELLYRYSININSRKTRSKLKRPTIFQVLNDNEIDNLLKVCVALCKKNSINIDDILIA